MARPDINRMNAFAQHRLSINDDIIDPFGKVKEIFEGGLLL
jgi:hypothetical protein